MTRHLLRRTALASALMLSALGCFAAVALADLSFDRFPIEASPMDLVVGPDRASWVLD